MVLARMFKAWTKEAKAHYFGSRGTSIYIPISSSSTNLMMLCRQTRMSNFIKYMQYCITLAAKGILAQHPWKHHTETLKACIVEQNVNLRNLPEVALNCLQSDGKRGENIYTILSRNLK